MHDRCIGRARPVRLSRPQLIIFSSGERPRTPCSGRGHHVVVHTRNRDRLAAVRDLVGQGAKAVVGDLADLEQTREIAEQANALGGHRDGSAGGEEQVEQRSSEYAPHVTGPPGQGLVGPSLDHYVVPVPIEGTPSPREGRRCRGPWRRSGRPISRRRLTTPVPGLAGPMPKLVAKCVQIREDLLGQSDSDHRVRSSMRAGRAHIREEPICRMVKQHRAASYTKG
ncbi:MAG: daunorubicin ketoreductase [Propionibacteriaceae bacterium]|nr:daunorubicin ketoreductase [Propionibacteriaceae bacterium]